MVPVAITIGIRSQATSKPLPEKLAPPRNVRFGS